MLKDRLSTRELLRIFESFKDQLQLPFFMEIVVTLCWSIWTIINDVIFMNIQASVQRCKTIFKTEFALITLRARANYIILFNARSLCVILSIFFVSFFVSSFCIVEPFCTFFCNKAQQVVKSLLFPFKKKIIYSIY